MSSTRFVMAGSWSVLSVTLQLDKPSSSMNAATLFATNSWVAPFLGTMVPMIILVSVLSDGMQLGSPRITHHVRAHEAIVHVHLADVSNAILLHSVARSPSFSANAMRAPTPVRQMG